MACRVEFLELLLGRFIFMSFGVVIVEEMTKNKSNRKIISVMDDMENDASALFLLFNAIELMFKKR
jgi:hypothetical protein